MLTHSLVSWLWGWLDCLYWYRLFVVIRRRGTHNTSPPCRLLKGNINRALGFNTSPSDWYRVTPANRHNSVMREEWGKPIVDLPLAACKIEYWMIFPWSTILPVTMQYTNAARSLVTYELWPDGIFLEATSRNQAKGRFLERWLWSSRVNLLICFSRGP